MIRANKNPHVDNVLEFSMLHNFLQNWFHLFMQLKECLIIVAAHKQKEIIENNTRIYTSSENQLLSQNSKYANLRLIERCYIYMF